MIDITNVNVSFPKIFANDFLFGLRRFKNKAACCSDLITVVQTSTTLPLLIQQTSIELKAFYQTK
jgi:hypothetical protein